MQEVRIHKFETQYRLPQWALAEQRRLDQLRATVLDEAFALALSRAGAPEESELCIRRLHALVSLRLDGTDASLTAAWVMALAEEIEGALRDGSSSNSSSNVVLYQSRRQALVDMAIGVSRGDLRRAWAWRRLGLWRAGNITGESEAVFELLQTLCAEPVMVVAVLCALAQAGRLERVARRLTERQWEALAFAALSPAGATHLLDRTDHAASPRALRDALLVINGARQLRPIMASSRLMAESDVARRAVAALTMVEAAPALLRTKTAPAVIALIAEALRSGSSRVKDGLPEPAELDAAETTGRIEPGKFGATRDSSFETDEEADVPLELRQRALTRYGGLLFLLGMIEDLIDEILADAALGARPFPWVMHQLALALVEVEPDDPVALAFAGLPPDASPPSAEQDAPNELEASALNALAARLVERLRLLLEREDEAEQSLLDFVCRRHAEVMAEPGWIEARFSLDDVSTEIRRAGLDLNPGYVAWLGVVVRFVYE